MNTPNLFMEFTKEELEQTLVFKQIKKRLRLEYPWILDVKGDDENPFRYKNIIFLKIIFDLEAFSEQTGLTILPYMIRDRVTFGDRTFMNVYSKLCIVTVEDCNNPITTEIEAETLRLLNIGIKSKAYPPELVSMLGNRVFHVSEWVPKYIDI